MFQGAPVAVNRTSKMMIVGDQQHMQIGASASRGGKASATSIGPQASSKPRATSAYGNASRRNLHPGVVTGAGHNAAANERASMGIH